MKTNLTLNISLITLAVLFSFTACQQEIREKPVLINTIQKLNIPIERLSFYASGNEWLASLHSFTQHIDLLIHYTDTGFYLSQENDLGIVEGPGLICLRSGENYFYYDVNLVNKVTPPLESYDYRSPKTVNSDSILTHQKLAFEVDKCRNIVESGEKSDFFEEKEIALPSKAGTYRAQSEIPLSSYYVQPGSCTKIDIKATYQKDNSSFQVIAGALTDTYDNLVADGTLVTFVYSDGEYTYQMEAASLIGFATVKIPTQNSRAYVLFAKVDNTISSKINLKAL